MATAINAVTLYGNNDVVTYMPNSLIYDLGSPERTVSPQVVGDGATENVVTQDFSTQKSRLSFDLKSTSENEKLVQTWLVALDGNVFKVVSPEGKTRVFSKAVVVNNPEINASSDGVISIDVESEPAVVG